MSGNSGKTPFSFGKADGNSSFQFTKFTAGSNNDEPPKFSFGGSSNASGTPAFSFGNHTTNSNSSEEAKEKPKSSFGNSLTNSSFKFETTPSITPKTEPQSATTSSPSSSLFNTQTKTPKNSEATNAEPKKFLFGSSTTASSEFPTASSTTDDSKANIFAFKDTYETEITKGKELNTDEKPESTGDEKKKDSDFLKTYQTPSMNHLITKNEDDVADVDERMGDDADGDEFFDIDIDSKTNLPIRKLTYDVDGTAFSKDRLSFAVSDKTEKGMLFVTSGQNKESQLFPFDLIPQLDESSEYKAFLEKAYKEFEPLLEHRSYKNFIRGDESEQFGVVSNIREARRDQQLTLRRILSAMLQYLDELIKTKMNLDLGKFNDRWIVNYEECINVLYLLNALHFGDVNETIVLLQQWIERVEIQPNDELLEAILDGEEKGAIHANPLFWSVYLKKLILRGSFATLIGDLRASGYEELRGTDSELYQLIEGMVGLISEYDPVKFSFDMNSFLRWKRGAVELRETATSVVTENSSIQVELINLLNVLSGSSAAIDANAGTWYENLVAHFLYQMPSKKLISEYLSKSLADEGYEKPFEGVDFWESVCVELIKGKFLTVISSLESLDKSIGTFVAILITAAGLLDVYSKDLEGKDIVRKRETIVGIEQNIDRMVEDLALTYLNDQKLFAIGVGMMINIGSNKCREILAEVLPKYEIRDSDDFEWVLSICAELKLTKTKEMIQQIQGEKFYSKQLIPNALGCFAEAKSSEKVIGTVWRLFEDTLLNKGLDAHLASQLFESDVCRNNAILRQSLSPLYVLNEVISQTGALKGEQHVLWFSRLISLFDFAYLPGEYIPGLLLLVLENLNRNVFALKELTQLIERVNRYEKQLEEEGDDMQQRAEKLYAVIIRSWGSSVNGHGHGQGLVGLIHDVRRGIALDVSFTFLEESTD